MKLQIWDTAGQERFHTITSSYYHNAHGIAVVYDVSNRESFDAVNHWFSEVDKLAASEVCKLLIGNKSDLSAQRTVSESEGRALASSLGIPFLETSAKNSLNVDAMFVSIAKFIYEKKSQRVLDTDQGQDAIELKSGRTVTADERASYCSYC